MPAPACSGELKPTVPEVCEGLTTSASAFWMVCLIVFIDSLGGSISAPVLPFYAQEFNCTIADVGLLFSAFSLAQVIFLPIMGYLSDHFGRRKVLVLSLFGAAVGSFGQGLAPNYWCLMAARVISGACGAVGSTANVYVSDITLERARGQYLGYLMNSNGAAFAFGPGLGGGLSRLGLNVPVEINGAACLFCGVLAFRYLPESPVFVRHQQEAARLEGRSQRHGSWLSSFPASVWAICAVEFLRGMSFSAIFTLYGLFANKVYGLSPLHIGYAVCMGALTLIFTNVWVTVPLEHVVGRIGSAAVGTCLMACGELVLAFAPNLHLSLLGMWAVYMGQAIAGCNIAAITSTLAHEDNRGEVMSMQQMSQAAGRVVGPIALGHLSDLNLRWPFAMAAACVLVAAAILLGLKRRYDRRVADSTFEAPLLPSPRPPSENFTAEDIKELGTFLCELLASGGYQWHEESQRAALKKALSFYFPPLGSDAASHTETPGLRRALIPKSMQKDDPGQLARAISGMGAEINFTGTDSNFLRSPELGRRVFQRQAHPHRHAIRSEWG